MYNSFYSQADSYLQNRFSNADGAYGWQSMDAGPNATAGFGNADGGYGWQSAQGNMPVNSQAPMSQPYEIKVVNASTGSLNCTLFGAYTNAAVGVINFGNSASLTITSTISGVTYAQLLLQTMQKPFEVAEMFVNSSTSAQLTANYTLNFTDANGNNFGKPIVTKKDPYQNSSTDLIIPYRYKIDGATDLQFTMEASATVIITFYPIASFDAFRIAMGGNPVKRYSSPNLVKALPVSAIGSNGSL